MFNLQGSEIIFILLIALVVLGPEKLPGAIKRVTQMYAEFRKMSSGFQSEFKSVIDEPMREMRETADMVRNAADPKKIAEEAEKAAEAEAALAKVERAEAAERAKQGDGPGEAGETTEAGESERSDGERAPALTPVSDEPDAIDEWADPVDDPAADTSIDDTAGAAREDTDESEFIEIANADDVAETAETAEVVETVDVAETADVVENADNLESVEGELSEESA